MQFDKTDLKLNDTASQVATEVQESCDSCLLSTSQITSGEFSCQQESSEDEVTYRARLRGNTDSDCSDIIDNIATWLEGSPASITVQGNRLSLASNCDVEVDNFGSALECEQIPTGGVTTVGLGSTEAVSVPIIAGAAAGGALLVIVILVVIIVVISLVVSSKRKRKRYVCVCS